ncbi:MAG: hypothetical protein IJK02_05295 [Clostridia bacterium]|nr:hypothetical protein [Clostridia bacterium]
MAAEVLTNAGLYMLGYYIQLTTRDWTDRESGEVTVKFYMTVAAGKSIRGGSVDVSLSAEEYDALEDKVKEKALKVGSMVLVPVESFGYRDKAYLRAIGPVSVLQEEGVAVEVPA